MDICSGPHINCERQGWHEAAAPLVDTVTPKLVGCIR